MSEPNSVVDFDLLNSCLETAGSPWIAAANRITVLDRAEQELRLGVRLPARSERELIQARAVAISAESAKSTDLPVRFDLRDVDGVDYITPTPHREYRRPCNSCVAFGVTTAVESTVRYTRRAVHSATDLSEPVWSCGAGAGVTCQSGWMPLAALNQATSALRDQWDRPSKAGGTTAPPPADRHLHHGIPTGLNDVTGSISRIKEHLLTYGGVTACMEVFSDFFAYRDGVYQHASGSSRGGLCVVIVGWDDRFNAWIIMNNWGTSWGQNGFGLVRYGEVFIDSWQNIGVTGVAVHTWSSPQKILGAYSSGDARNGWVYLAKTGWLKVGGETEHAHTLLFTDLLAAKNAGAVVNAFICDGQVNQVYAN